MGQHDLGVGGQVRKVRKLKIHAKYNASTTDYDIGLIQMDQPVVFERSVRPVCLPREDLQDITGTDTR